MLWSYAARQNIFRARQQVMTESYAPQQTGTLMANMQSSEINYGANLFVHIFNDFHKYISSANFAALFQMRKFVIHTMWKYAQD